MGSYFRSATEKLKQSCKKKKKKEEKSFQSQLLTDMFTAVLLQIPGIKDH